MSIVRDYPIDLEKALWLLGYWINEPNVAFNFTGSTAGNDETAFDALTWLDPRPKPSWQDILDNNPGAIDQWRQEIFYDNYLPDKEILAIAVSNIASLTSGLSGVLGSLPSTLDDLADGTTNKGFTATLRTKLNGISSGATANDTDANLKNRANHTGSQAISTITGLQTALDGKQALITAGSAITNAATDAATNLATNYNLATGILGLANALNTANGAQNDLANKYNDLAGKVNTLMTHLRTQGLQST